MNTTLIKNLVIFGAGAILGVIGMNFYLKDKNEQYIQEEIESIVKHYNARQVADDTEILNEDMVNEDNKDEDLRETIKKKYGSDEMHVPVGKKNLIYRKPEHEQKTSYNLIKEPINKGASIPIEEELDTSFPGRIISFEEFTEECDEYEKITMYYYSIDEVLCDDQEVVIVDVPSLIGHDALVNFETGGGTGNTNDVVYVRNDHLESDFEVIRINSSYRETVEGLPNAKEDVTPKRRKKE